MSKRKNKHIDDDDDADEGDTKSKRSSSGSRYHDGKFILARVHLLDGTAADFTLEVGPVAF